MVRCCWKLQYRQTARSPRSSESSPAANQFRLCRPRWCTWFAVCWCRSRWGPVWRHPTVDRPTRWSTRFLHLGHVGLIVPRLHVEQDGRLGNDRRFLWFLGKVGGNTLLTDTCSRCVLLLAVGSKEIYIIIILLQAARLDASNDAMWRYHRWLWATPPVGAFSRASNTERSAFDGV